MCPNCPFSLSTPASCLWEHRPTGGLPCTTGWAASHVSECTCGCLTSWVFNTLQNTCLFIQTVCPPAITFCLELQSSSDIFTQHFKCYSWPKRLIQLSPFFPVIFHFGFPSISEQPALYVKCVFVFTALYLRRTCVIGKLCFPWGLLFMLPVGSLSHCLASQWATLFQLGFWPLHKDPKKRSEKREPVVTVLNWPY